MSNWRDDTRHADYEDPSRQHAREYAAQAQTDREASREQRDAANDGPPDFHQPAPTPIIAAPRMAAVWPPRAIAPPAATERAEAKARDAADLPESRMSIAQLRDRISGMEVTTARKAQAEHTARNTARERGDLTHKGEKPHAKRERADKLASYRAELARRIEASKRSDEGAARENAALAARSTATQAEPADVPQLVVCGICGLLIQQDENGDMEGHLDRRQIECPAKPTNWARHRTNPNFAHTIAAPAPKHDTTTQAARAAEINAADSPYVRAQEIPPPPPAAAAAIVTASATRRAVVATAAASSQAEPSDLERALDSLLDQWTLGEILDAVWATDQRRFKSRLEKARK